MKIPLELYKVSSRLQTRLRASASIRFKDRPAIGVTFIIDTGSPITFVDEFVSSKVRIYTKNLRFDHDALMGGTKIAMYNAGDVIVDFIDSEGTLAKLSFKDMIVAKTEWTRKEAIYSGVSIIGLDFLSQVGAKLVVDPGKNVAYLEI